MFLETGYRSESLDSSLGREPNERKHSKTSILDLLEAGLGRIHAGGVLELEVTSLFKALGTEAFEDDKGGDTDKELSLDVNSVFLSTGSPPITASEEILSQDTSYGSHGPASVDDLSILIVLQQIGLGT
jgi:hypothetical protein